jgi:organic hydroperoxide reductase OsmC/OhrA
MLLAAASAACAGSQAEQVRDARNESIADNTVARTRDIENHEAATVKGIEHEHDAVSGRAIQSSASAS